MKKTLGSAEGFLLCKNDFDQLVGENAVHFARRVVNAVAEERGRVHAACREGLPDRVAIADGDVHLTAKLPCPLDVNVENALVLALHRALRERKQIRGDHVLGRVRIHHVRRHENDLASAGAEAVEDLLQSSDVALRIIRDLAAIVKPVANDCQIGLMRDHVRLHSFRAVPRVVTRNARVHGAQIRIRVQIAQVLRKIADVAVRGIVNADLERAEGHAVAEKGDRNTFVIL